MTELYLGGELYRAHVERLIPVAGTGNVDQIKAVLGPLANDRPDLLASYLAYLPPCPVTGTITDNEIKIALGEIGDIWDRSISGPVMVALMEDRFRSPVIA